MSKRLILVLALAFVVGITMSAYAEIQNVKVSGDLLMRGITRNNIQLRDSAVDKFGTPYAEYDTPIRGFLSQVRVRVDADLTDNVSATVRLLNERVWDAESSANTDIDLDLAYISLKEFLYSPLSLTIGRQELMFGNQLVIGDVDTNNFATGHGTGTGTAGTILPKSLDDLSLRKAFDAVRATLDYDPLVVDLVYAMIDENSIDLNDDVTLFGANANYALDRNTILELYFWEKLRKKVYLATGGSSTSRTGPDDSVRTLGGRVQYMGIKGLALGLEGAWQFGEYVANSTLHIDDPVNDNGVRDRDAYAIQFTSSYNLSDLSEKVAKYQPVVSLGYTVLSGEKFGRIATDYKGWDPMFENQAGGTLFNKIFGFSNVRLLQLGAAVSPIEDVRLDLTWYKLNFVKSYPGDNSVANLTGVTGDPTYAVKGGESDIGNELDINLTYDYTEDVQIGLGTGFFFPGDAFDTNNDRTAGQFIGSMKVTF